MQVQVASFIFSRVMGIEEPIFFLQTLISYLTPILLEFLQLFFGSLEPFLPQFLSVAFIFSFFLPFFAPLHLETSIPSLDFLIFDYLQQDSSSRLIKAFPFPIHFRLVFIIFYSLIVILLYLAPTLLQHYSPYLVVIFYLLADLVLPTILCFSSTTFY